MAQMKRKTKRGIEWRYTIVLLYSWFREVGARCWDEESCEPDGASIVSCSWWMRDGRLPLRSSRTGPNRQVQERVWRCWWCRAEARRRCLDVCLVWIEMVSSAASSVPSRPDRSCETSLLRSGILSRQLRSTTTHSATTGANCTRALREARWTTVTSLAT